MRNGSDSIPLEQDLSRTEKFYSLFISGRLHNKAGRQAALKGGLAARPDYGGGSGDIR